MSNRDPHAGQGGTYEIRGGKRFLKEGSRTQPSEGGGARDASGKPIKEELAHLTPALPEPAPAPWLPPEPSSPEPAAGNVKPIGGGKRKPGELDT